MILLVVIIAVCVALWAIYSFFAYRKRDMRGEIVLITGGGSGLGRGAAIEFAKLGCSLILWDLNEAGLAGAKKDVEAAGATCATYVVDISDREAVARTAKLCGRVDTLVNNAGIVCAKPLLETPDSMIQKTMDVNSTAHFWTIKAFLPGMIERKQGHLVTVASVAGLFGSPQSLGVYHASKGAAALLGEALYLEMRMFHPFIRTTTLCPFFIRVPGRENEGLFAGVESKIVPVLEMPYVVNRLVEGVQRGEEKIVVPWLCWAAQALKVLPAPICAWTMDFLGVSSSMSTFTGKTAHAK